jgi:predicted transcriptional regulator YdeE
VDIIATWQEIWAKERELNRSYIADFEVYDEKDVTIYIGVKD